MAGTIKGITVEIGGNTGPLEKALQGVNKVSRDLQSELKSVDKLLKLDPTNTVLLTQKQKLLAESVTNTKEKLQTLKTAEAQAQQQFKEGKIGADQYRKLQQEVVKTEQELKKLESQASKSSVALNKISIAAGKAGEAAGTVGKKMAPVSIAITGIGVAALNAGMNFEAGMSKVKAISGATGAEFETLNKLALQLGKDTAFSASEAAGGMENLASAGFKVNEIIAAMPGMLDLAASGGLDVATASDIASSALRSFGLGADQSGHFADVLAKAAADTNANVTDMGMALKYAAAPAYALGLSVEEVSAAIGIMADAGIKGEQSGTTLRGALLALASPSGPAADAMKAIGLEVFDATGKMLPFKDVIGAVTESTKKLTQEEKVNALATIFGREAVSGMMVLIEKGPAKFDALTQSFKTSDGAAKDMAKTMLDNGKGSLEAMSGSIETAAITMSKVLAPIIREIIDYITGLANKFASFDIGTQKTILVVIGLIAAISPLAFAIQGLAVAISFLAANPIVLAIIAIVAVIVLLTIGIKKLWDTNEGFRTAIINIWNGIKSVVGTVVNALVQFFTVALPQAWNGLVAIFTGIPAWFDGLWNEVKTATVNVWNSINSTIQNVFNGIKNFFVSVWSGIKNTFVNTISGIVNFVTTTFGKQINDIYVIFLSLVRIFTAVWEIIKNIFLGAILLIIDLVTGNFTQLKADAANIFDSLKTYFGDIWDNIKLIFSRAISLIVSFCTGAWNGLVAVGKAIFNGLKNYYVGLWESIKSSAVNAWNGLRNGVSSIMSSTVSGAKATFNGLLTFFRNLPNTMHSLGSNMMNGLKNGISSMMSTIRSVIINGLNTSISFITSLPGKALQWGKDFINGLKNGIMSAINGIANAVKNIASTIRGYLHFSTPDEGPLKDYENWMPDFMSGLARGIEDSKYKVANAIKGLSSDVNIGMHLTPAMAGMGGVGSIADQTKSTETVTNGVVVQNMYVRNDNDIKLVAKELYSLQRGRSRGQGVTT